jgi:hypothetical protein
MYYLCRLESLSVLTPIGKHINFQFEELWSLQKLHHVSPYGGVF